MTWPIKTIADAVIDLNSEHCEIEAAVETIQVLHEQMRDVLDTMMMSPAGDVSRHAGKADVLYRLMMRLVNDIGAAVNSGNQIVSQISELHSAPLPKVQRDGAQGLNRQQALEVGANAPLTFLAEAEAANRAADAAWRASGAPDEDSDKFVDHRRLIIEFDQMLQENYVQADQHRREGFMRGLVCLFCCLCEGSIPGPNYDALEMTDRTLGAAPLQLSSTVADEVAFHHPAPRPAAKPRGKKASAPAPVAELAA